MAVSAISEGNGAVTFLCRSVWGGFLTPLLFLGPFPSCDPTTGTRLWPTPTRKPGTRCSCGGRRPGSWNKRYQGDGGAGMLPRTGKDGGPRVASQPGKGISVLDGEGAEVQMAAGDSLGGPCDCSRLSKSWQHSWEDAHTRPLHPAAASHASPRPGVNSLPPLPHLSWPLRRKWSLCSDSR